jgi:hypothetical protein
MPDRERAPRAMEQQIRRWEQRGDRRAIFLGCYLLMTRNMMQAMDRGHFDDGIWVSSLLHHFAAYYFDALNRYEEDHPSTPLVWRGAHQAAAASETPAHQNLLLGVNAHINYDLALALVDALENEWPRLSPERRRTRRRDHNRVNQIIGETVDSVQDQVLERYQPSMDLVDKLMGPLDEWLASRLIAGWRDSVWEVAVEMLEAAGEEEREEIRRRVEADTLKRARRILSGAL